MAHGSASSEDALASGDSSRRLRRARPRWSWIGASASALGLIVSAAWLQAGPVGADAAEDPLCDGSGVCTVSFTADLDQDHFPTTGDVQVPQLELPPGAIADSVQLDAAVTGSVLATMWDYRDLSSPAITFTSTVDASISITGKLLDPAQLQLTTYTATAHKSETFIVEPDHSANEETTATGSTSSGVVSFAEHPELLPDYVGSGEVVYPVTSDITWSVSTPGGGQTTVTGHGSASITVTYTYHYAPTETTPADSSAPSPS